MRSLKGQRTPRAARTARALQLLEQTASSRVRNAAALALADMKERNAKKPLVNLLSRPDTKGSRGTLLYALEQLGESVPLPILAEIIINDSYEAREEALGFISQHRIDGDAEEFALATMKLESALPLSDTERLRAIQRALDQLKVKPHLSAER